MSNESVTLSDAVKSAYNDLADATGEVERLQEALRDAETNRTKTQQRLSDARCALRDYEERQVMPLVKRILAVERPQRWDAAPHWLAPNASTALRAVLERYGLTDGSGAAEATYDRLLPLTEGTRTVKYLREVQALCPEDQARVLRRTSSFFDLAYLPRPDDFEIAEAILAALSE